MSTRFKYIQDILRRVSREEEVDLAEVERVWDHHEKMIAKYLRDPLAPKVTITGMMKMLPKPKLITKEIFKHLHVGRKSKSPAQSFRSRKRIVELLKIQSRLDEEAKSYAHNKGKNPNKN